MTTLAKDIVRVYESGPDPFTNELPVIATDIIYEGAAVGDNGSGYSRPLVGGDPFRGFCIDIADNSTGAAGAVLVKIRSSGVIKLAVVGAASIADELKPVYATDDNTFTLTPVAGSTRIGFVHRWVSGTTCLVFFQAASLSGSTRYDTSSGSVVVPYNYNAPADTAFFIADRPYRVKAIRARTTIIGSDGGAVTGVVKKAASGTAVSGGTALHSGTFDLKGAANTNQAITLSATPADLDIDAGDAIGLDVTGTTTAATGTITLFLEPR